jgi:hypothetical protein
MTRFALLFLLFTSAAAQAQLRTIPQDALRGTISHVQEMIVDIDGTQRRLAEGAQIRDRQNRVVLPTAIPPGTPVKYQLDADGVVQAVWFLTHKEAQAQ